MVPDRNAAYILVAEDNESDLLLIREALREHKIGWRVLVIGDGEAAMAFIDEMDADTGRQCPAIVLLDLHLPKRDGHAILEHLRASTRCASVAVVVLTSSLSPAEKNKVERHPPVHFFRKPSSLDQFMELGLIVRNALTDDATG